ncbi:MAG: hypothetical protein M3Q47_12595 [Actinomycetota bacterium]|nr:hypothetical protein [Actinomycetota bacterium]
MPTGRHPHPTRPDDGAAGFLVVPDPTAEALRLYAADLAEFGFVLNASRLWAHQPTSHTRLFELLEQAAGSAGLTAQQRAVLVAACASALGDAYCSFAWGSKLAAEAGPDVAAAVLQGGEAGLDPTEAALARWARHVAAMPNATTADDVRRCGTSGTTTPRSWPSRRSSPSASPSPP